MANRGVLHLLKGGNRRSIGRADHVVLLVSGHPHLFYELVRGLWSDDSVVRMRAADATEKVTRNHHDWLQPYKDELLGLMITAREPELRWHLAAMVPRLTLDRTEQNSVVSAFNEYLEDRSSLVKTFALQGLADMARAAPRFRTLVVQLLSEAGRKGTAAMRARSRKLLRSLDPV